MKKKQVTLVMFIIIVAIDIGESIANLLLKKGLNNTCIASIRLDNAFDFLIKAFSSPLLWIGILIFTINLFLWITVLSRVDLSVAKVVCSTSYIFVPILAMIFLHEDMNLTRWVGIAFIIAGIYLVSQVKHRKKTV